MRISAERWLEVCFRGFKSMVIVIDDHPIREPILYNQNHPKADTSNGIDADHLPLLRRSVALQSSLSGKHSLFVTP